jgi:peptidoglycan/xylan/chitin deacetylase (PgdA/CDA1 family)
VSSDPPEAEAATLSRPSAAVTILGTMPHIFRINRITRPLLLAGAVLMATTIAFAQPSVPVSDEEVTEGDTSRPNVALVLNVGAGFEPGLPLLEALAERNQKLTFFVMGWWAERHQDVLRAIADGGHEIASHGHSVFDLRTVSDAAVREDLRAADSAISAVTGKSTKPLWSPSAGYRDDRVRGIAAGEGYRPILWTLDSLDWTYEATEHSVYTRVMERTGNGTIVVMHFDSPTTLNSTARALPRIINDLRANGFKIMTITELLTAS